MLTAAAEGGGKRVVLAHWAAEVGGEVASSEVAADGAAAVASALLANVGRLTGGGGVCLFCYSCVLTRGLDAVRADVARDDGLTPLISGPHALCGTELVREPSRHEHTHVAMTKKNPMRA